MTAHASTADVPLSTAVPIEGRDFFRNGIRRGLLESIAAMPSAMDVALRALDARLAREQQRMRARGTLTLDELRGVYASDERVERLLIPVREPDVACDGDEASLSEPLLVRPEWRALSQLASTSVERDLVLLALARERRLDYETIFGYLNDDLTRRWPSRELALRLLARDESERVHLTDAMGERAPLFAHGVLRVIPCGEHCSWLAEGIALSPLAAALLGGSSAPERRLPLGVAWLDGLDGDETTPDALWESLSQIIQPAFDDLPVPLVVLEGRQGSGRTGLARRLARELECSLLCVDLSDAQAEQALSAALLWQRLSGAVVIADGITTSTRAIARRLRDARGPVLCRVDAGAHWHEASGPLRVAHIVVPSATLAERAFAWRDALRRTNGMHLDNEDALALADRFDLTVGNIARIVRRADDQGALARTDRAHHSTDATRILSETARTDSGDALGSMATRAPTPHGWSDLVLPGPTLSRLRDVHAAIRDRATVLDGWGFGRKTTRARGISALFAGASGTGKTMAAGVLARELALDLFVIDLSAVVSKYIGDTEKNLERIFSAARDAGAVLFFDEADALFGKRSEVKDAHDRYANIEVAYLLQQLDAHDGVVILATNMSRNLDAAFSRRMRYVVDFPLPGEADRLRLWRTIFPADAPLAADVDLPFLAAQFPLAGGDIRNVALEAAYLAAADATRDVAREIAMRHVVRAMARQMIKQGRTPSAAEFRQHVALIDRDA